ncbi:MAG: hypothetical protein JJE13_04715 [Thermoleophilia bacterium]|nr:hypothetical protein [Thermoleophilia bacterium]
MILAAWLCAPTPAVASPAPSGDPVVQSTRAKLKRHQSKYWIWYAPRRWVAAKGASGIVVSSPDSGRKSVGVGFAGSGYPVSHAFVFKYLKASGGLDSHPLRNVRVIRKSRKIGFRGGSRQVYVWTARRADLRAKVRGELKIDVFSSVGYGFMVAGINAPNASWRKDFRLLRRIAGAIFYRPQAIDPWKPRG